MTRHELDARDRKAAALAQVLDATGYAQATLRRMSDADWEIVTEIARRLTGVNHGTPSIRTRRRTLAMVRLRRYHQRIERAAGL